MTTETRMIRVFDTYSKVNFVDTNNVLVGYDNGQHCCELAEYFLSSMPYPSGRTQTEIKHGVELIGYCFDTESEPIHGGDCDGADGAWVAFRLVHDFEPEMWLVLSNHHNGYYSHGFTYAAPGREEVDGAL